MPSFETSRRRWPRLLGLLVASYAICAAGFVLRASLSRSNHADGAMDGLFFSMLLVTVPWLIIVAPLTVGGYYAPVGPERFRTLIVLAPSIVATLLILSPLLTNPPAAANRFQSLTDHALPGSARDVRVFDKGGGSEGAETTFFFHCAAGDTAELIRALDLQPTAKDEPPYSDRPDTTWPDPHQWEGRAFYSKERPFVEAGSRSPGRNYYLCTDGTRTQVWLAVVP